MCNMDAACGSRPPSIPSPQCDLRTFTCVDASRSLADIVSKFLATLVDGKEFICQLETTFSNELWPAVRAELANSRCRVMELERRVEEYNKQREEMALLAVEGENERSLLLAENWSLRTELDQLFRQAEGVVKEEVSRATGSLVQENEILRRNYDQLLRQAEGVVQEGTSKATGSLVQENEILQNKLDILLEENLSGEKLRKSLAEEVEQLQEAAKLSTIKEIFLETENKKFAMVRSQIEKSEDLHAKGLSLKGQKKLRKDQSPSPTAACRDVEPVRSLDPLSSKSRSLVQSVSRLQGNDQAMDCAASDLGKKDKIRGTSPADNEGDRADEAAGGVRLGIPPSAEVISQGDQATDLEPEDAIDVVCSQRQNENTDAESKPRPCAGFVDSNATTIDAFQEGPLSAGIVPEYPVVSISSETQAGPCDDEPLELPSGRIIEPLLRGTSEQKVEERGIVQEALALVSISPNLPREKKPARTKASEKKPKKKPTEQPWRKTRHRAEPSVRDPHDSFLDTPRNRVLAQLGAKIGKAAEGGPTSVTNKPDGGRVGREGGQAARKRPAHPSPGSRLVVERSNAGRPNRAEAKAPATKAPPVKFNEPVRKKRDREALQGTDCKQCKKFYDAVAAGDASEMEASRCEHQNAVSRHRFKYLPPPTPDGFWNIGFDDSIRPSDHGR